MPYNGSRSYVHLSTLSLSADSRVPVINLEDGSRLSGDDAPLKKNLETWMEKHPGFMVDSREELEEGEIVSCYLELDGNT